MEVTRPCYTLRVISAAKELRPGDDTATWSRAKRSPPPTPRDDRGGPRWGHIEEVSQLLRDMEDSVAKRRWWRRTRISAMTSARSVTRSSCATPRQGDAQKFDSVRTEHPSTRSRFLFWLGRGLQLGSFFGPATAPASAPTTPPPPGNGNAACFVGLSGRGVGGVELRTWPGPASPGPGLLFYGL